MHNRMVITNGSFFYLTYEKDWIRIKSSRKKEAYYGDKFYAKGPGNNGYIKNLGSSRFQSLGW